MDGLALQEICQRLSLSKGTVYHWLKDLPLQRKPRYGHNLRSVSTHFKNLRDAAYACGCEEYKSLATESSFREFLVLYLSEGYRRSRNQVAVGNSNPDLVLLGHYWIKRLRNPERVIGYQLQYHVDQNPTQLRRLWSEKLDIQPSQIKLQRKSNSGGLTGRKWRSVFGILTVRVSDTYLRARLQAWMDNLSSEWVLLRGEGKR